MKKKTFLKIIVASLLTIFAFFGSIFLGMFIVPNFLGGLLGCIVGVLIVLVIIGRFYPTWFRDYIDEFWKKEEEKKCLEKEVE